MDPIQRVASREVYRNPWMIAREDDIRREDGSTGIFGVIDKPHGVIIVPWDGERLCMVNQYRYTLRQRAWEFPAGTAPNLAEADPYELAAHELREETGLRAKSMVRLHRIAVVPGVASQYNSFFLATDLSAGEVAREHEEQDMRSGWFSKAEFEAMLKSGEIIDSQTVAAYMMFLLCKGER